MYSPQLLDHFQNPRNAGELADAEASAEVENPACGDVLKLMLKFADGRISEIRFLAKGCVPSMACGSAITEMARGKTIEEAGKIHRNQLIDALGNLPPASSHAADLALDTLRAALQACNSKRGESSR